MSKYTNMYLPWSDQDLYFDKIIVLLSLNHQVRVGKKLKSRKILKSLQEFATLVLRTGTISILRKFGNRQDDCWRSNRCSCGVCGWINSPDSVVQEDETLDEQIIVVKTHLYIGMPISEVSRKYNFDIKVIRLYIKKFKQSLKLRKRANIKYFGKNKKLKEEHKETLKELISNQVNCILTLDDMRTELLKRILRFRVCRWQLSVDD